MFSPHALFPTIKHLFGIFSIQCTIYMQMFCNVWNICHVQKYLQYWMIQYFLIVWNTFTFKEISQHLLLRRLFSSSEGCTDLCFLMISSINWRIRWINLNLQFLMFLWLAEKYKLNDYLVRLKQKSVQWID